MDDRREYGAKRNEKLAGVRPLVQIIIRRIRDGERNNQNNEIVSHLSFPKVVDCNGTSARHAACEPPNRCGRRRQSSYQNSTSDNSVGQFR